MWWTAQLVACSGESAPAPAVVEPADAASAPHLARAAPAREAPWEGRWSVAVVTDAPDDGARTLAATLGVQLSSWASAPAGRPGLVVVTWLPSGSDLTPVAAHAPTGGAAFVVVLGPGDAAWAGRAATELPWTGAGIIDCMASGSLWADPASLELGLSGALAGNLLADAYGLPFTPLPADAVAGHPGLDALLGPPDVRHLSATDVRTRAEAARRGGADALVRDPESAVRIAVATSTTDAGALSVLATDREPLVRARVADRSEDVGVLARLSADPSSIVRIVATHRLATISPGGRDDGPRMRALHEAAASPDAYQRWKAAFGIRDAPSLIKLLSDPDIDVRREAARTLGRTGDRAGTHALIAALHDENSFVRRWAAEGLGRLGDPAALPDLRIAAQEPTGLVAQDAARALAALGAPTSVRMWAPRGKPKSEAEIAARVRSPDATERKDIAKFLSGREDAAAIGWLMELAGDADSDVRKSAIDTMSWCQGTIPIVQRAVLDPDPDVRVTALDALRQNRGGTVDIIAPMLRDPDGEIRLRAAEALAALGPSEPLRALASDADERIRVAVIGVFPGMLAPDEPSILVRRAAGGASGGSSGADAMLADVGDLGYWARGAIAREDELVHLRLSWNDAADRPSAYRTLRPPVVRAYGHPDRG